MPAHAAEVSSEDTAISDLSREKMAPTIGDDVSTEQENVSSDSASPENEMSTNPELETNDLSMTSDTRESSDSYSRDIDSSIQDLPEDVPDNNDSDKNAQNNSNYSPDTRNIVSVSTEDQFVDAFNNASVTRINLSNNIFLTQSLSTLTRDLEINGNGFQLFTGDNGIRLGTNSVIRLTNLIFRTNLPPNNTAIMVEGNNVQIRLRDVDYSSDDVIFANRTASSDGWYYSIIFDGGVNNFNRSSRGSSNVIIANMALLELLNDSVVNINDARLSFRNAAGNDSLFNISEGSTINWNNSLWGGYPLNDLNTLNVDGKANIATGAADLGLGWVRNIKIGNTGELFFNSENSTSISWLTTNIEIARGSIFNITNLAGGSITNGDINISIDSESLSVWDLGLQAEEKASIVFSDVQTTLSGKNASAIDTSTNERFKKLYDSFGLSAYSRMSNLSIEEMTRTVNVHFIDTHGNELAESEVITGLLGENYQTRDKQISGYKLIDSPSNGQGEFSRDTIEVYYTYEVNLTAEAIPQKVTLGSSLEGADPKTLVKNVMLDEQVLSSDAYTVTVLSQPDTTIVRPDSEAKVQVSYDQTSIELSIPVEVLWGNTILTRGVNNWSTGAYTYHPETQKVTSRLGVSEGDGLIHRHFDRYYSLDFYHLSKDQEILNKDNLYYSYEVNGTDSRYQVIENFGNNGALNVSLGDVLKVYHAEPGGRLVQFQDEIESPIPTNTNKEAYLELTDTGYKFLTFDRAVPIERTIKVGMTQEELEKTVTQSLDLSATKDVSILGFTKYPDTSGKGTSSGTIRVEETLSTGKKVQYDYDVSFVVEAGDLKISELTNSDFYFGEAKRSSKVQEIQATGTIAPTITISDYSDTTKWSLYVSASPFVNQKNQELSGAQLTLKNFSLVNTVHQSLMVNSRAIVLSPSAQIVAAMTNPEYINGVENGETILQLGEAKDNLLTGVSLSLPANTPMDVGDYQATITWELVGDPTL